MMSKDERVTLTDALGCVHSTTFRAVKDRVHFCRELLPGHLRIVPPDPLSLGRLGNDCVPEVSLLLCAPVLATHCDVLGWKMLDERWVYFCQEVVMGGAGWM